MNISEIMKRMLFNWPQRGKRKSGRAHLHLETMEERITPAAEILVWNGSGTGDGAKFSVVAN